MARVEDLKELVDVVDALVAAFDDGAAGEPDGATPDSRGPGVDGATVVTLIGQAERLQALAARAAAAFHRSGRWADDGARSAAAWLSVEARLPRRCMARTVSLGAAVDELPRLRGAWSRGEIGTPHIAAVAPLLGRRTHDQLVRDEGMIADHARTLAYPAFRQALAYWAQLADPDGCEEDELARRARRRLSLHQSFEGQWFGDLSLDPVGGAIVSGELDRIEQQLFAADVDEAKARTEATPSEPGDLRRTSAQRRADALVVMATRSTAAGGRRMPAPLFTVLVDFPTVMGRVCQLASGGVLAPGAVAPWLTSADIERAVLRAPRRVDVSATTRLYSGATRRALEILDATCAHPYCDMPAAWCQADHIVRFADGGPTTQENGRLLCAYHNRLRERQRHRNGAQQSDRLADRADHGPCDHGQGDHSPSDHGPGDYDPSDHGPADHGPSDQNPSDRDPADYGPCDHSQGDQGPGDYGPSDQNSSDHGPSDRDPSDRGPRRTARRPPTADTCGDEVQVRAAPPAADDQRPPPAP